MTTPSKTTKISKLSKEEIGERRRAAQRSHYIRNKEMVLAKAAEWRRSNPEKRAGYAAKRRSTRYGLTTPKEAREAVMRIKALKAMLFATCAYCKKEFSARELQIDHIFPLSKGGRHVAENLVLACVSCNCSKGSKIVGEHSVNPTQPKGKRACTRRGSNPIAGLSSRSEKELELQ